MEIFRSGSYIFDFTDSGYFTLVNKKGEALFKEACPIFEKIISHLVWIFFWLTCVLISHLLLTHKILYYTDRILMMLVFLHLFLFGCRFTTLLLCGGLMPILFPPLWIKLTDKLHKGAGFELLEQYQLHKHPGLLSNLALFQYHRGETHAALTSIRSALFFLPNHPILLQLEQILLTHIP